MKEDTIDTFIIVFGSMTQHAMLCILCFVIFIAGMFAGTIFYHLELNSNSDTLYAKYTEAYRAKDKCQRTLDIIQDRPCCFDLINISLHHSIAHHTNFTSSYIEVSK